MTGSTPRVTFTEPNRLVSICAPEVLGPDLLEEAGVEVTRVVDQHIYAVKPIDSSFDCGLSVGRLGNV